MKTLYIVRHAKAVEHDPTHDFERGLATRGKADATAMGRLLAGMGAKPDLVVCSPAARTMATAILLGDRLDYAGTDIKEDRRIYNAEPDKLLKVIREVSDEANAVMIVGHNPGITDFSNSIFNTLIISFPTAGVTGGKLAIDSWKNVKWGCGKQDFFVSPD